MTEIEKFSEELVKKAEELTPDEISQRIGQIIDEYKQNHLSEEERIGTVETTVEVYWTNIHICVRFIIRPGGYWKHFCVAKFVDEAEAKKAFQKYHKEKDGVCHPSTTKINKGRLRLR